MRGSSAFYPSVSLRRPTDWTHDHLFDTREEVEKQAEAQKKLAAANKEFFDKQEAKAKVEG